MKIINKEWFILKVIRSTCNYCSIACNMDFHVEDDGFIKRVVPTVDYPVNKGFCCVKGLNLDKQNTVLTMSVREIEIWKKCCII